MDSLDQATVVQEASPKQANVIELEPNRNRDLRKFSFLLGGIAVLLSLIPFLIAISAVPPGQLLLGYPYNPDDHMVYAAWMRQSMDGNFFFNNRFTIIEQPGQTIHIYYWILGKIASVTGILWASTLARIISSFMFVVLLGSFIKRHNLKTFPSKIAITLSVFGMGIGFAIWENFGRIITRGPLVQLFQSRLTIDVWQPEAFVFSSMLTNGLFTTSLCLMLILMNCVLDLRSSSKPIIGGAIAMLVLMNIHSYDILTLAIVWVVFLCGMVFSKQITKEWLGRVLLMSLGMLPAALWFIKVFASDPVFQARAATPTFTAGFRATLGGLIFLVVFALIGIWKSGGNANKLNSKIAISAIAVLFTVGFFLSGVGESFWMQWPVWIALFGLMGVVLTQIVDREDTAKTMTIAWALGGIVACYAPVLFQRKMAAGIAIPWAILAAIGIASLLQNKERGERNMVMGITVFALCLGSIMWLRRDLSFVATNTTSTGTLPIILARDGQHIVNLISKIQDKEAVAIAPLGVPNQLPSGEFGTPFLVDMNPVITGMTGVYSLAGHWSETPNYNRMRTIQNDLLFNKGSFFEIYTSLNSRFKTIFVVSPSDLTFGGVAWRNFDGPEFEGVSDRIYSGQTLNLYKITLK